jgi:methylmalonyl-CoA mutase N-terminal domain/subunit
MEEKRAIPIFRLDPELEKRQIRRLGELRAGRDKGKLEGSLDRLEAAARGEENLMPFILDAAAAYATVGEISGRLRKVFGEYRETGAST